MDNGVYEAARDRFGAIYGRLGALESGTGSRCKRDEKGKVTLYRSNISPGNGAEIAFHVESMAARAGKSLASARDILQQLQLATGRPVQRDPKWDWPRVGLASVDHVELVASALEEYFSE